MQARFLSTFTKVTSGGSGSGSGGGCDVKGAARIELPDPEERPVSVKAEVGQQQKKVVVKQETIELSDDSEREADPKLSASDQGLGLDDKPGIRLWSPPHAEAVERPDPAASMGAGTLSLRKGGEGLVQKRKHDLAESGTARRLTRAQAAQQATAHEGNNFPTLWS